MLSEHTKKRITMLFNLQDWGNDGNIDEDDYRIALEKHAVTLGLDPGSAAYEGLAAALNNDWSQLREHADTDGDGTVSLEEFLAYHDAMFSHHQGAVAAIAQKILEGIDSDGDGRVSKQEWGAYMTLIEMDTSDLDTIFAKIDTNGNGYLSLEEVIDALNAWYLNEDPSHPGHWLFGDPAKLNQPPFSGRI